MSKTFAILHEPASYTVDRNSEVYDPLGIKYCYLYNHSKANNSKTEESEALSSLSFTKLFIRLRNILKNNDIIIMNGYNGKYFQILFLLNIFYKKKIGLDSDTPLYIPSNPVKKLIKSMCLNSTFRNKNTYGLAGGSGSHKDLFRHYGMPEERIFLMPMVVNNDKFKGKIRSLGKPFHFLYVGRIVPVKSIDLMIRAFIKSFDDKEDYELRIVGDGECLSLFKNKYQNHKNITFTGPIFGNHLVNEYHNASAFILPSSFEPWGLVVNEAMASGLPVIVSDQVGAAHDLVEGSNTGYIFKHDSVEDLASKMRKITVEPENYQEMSKNAFNLMHNHWNYNLYRECLMKFIDDPTPAPSPQGEGKTTHP